MQWMVWIEPDKRESMLNMVGKTRYVEGVLQGVVVVDPVWVLNLVCIGSLYRCTHLGNGTGRRTVTMAAQLSPASN